MAEVGPIPLEAGAREAAQANVALRRGYEAGVRAYGPLPLGLETYARHVLDHVRRRIERCGADAGRPAELPVDAHGADLFLATACEVDVPGAWDVLVERVLGTLGAVAGRRGASAAEAREILADLPGELCSPPAKGGARTRIGTYDGSGSLFAWLAVLVARRVIDLRRARYAPSTAPPRSLDSRPGEAAAAEAVADRSVQPEERVVHQESVGAFRRALRTAWARLTDREAIVVLCKHRDGLSQRDIARVLGVGEPRVSRILDAALAKLREGLSRDPAPSASAGQAPAWTLLAAALGSHLASSVPLHDIVGRDLPTHD